MRVEVLYSNVKNAAILLWYKIYAGLELGGFLR